MLLHPTWSYAAFFSLRCVLFWGDARWSSFAVQLVGNCCPCFRAPPVFKECRATGTSGGVDAQLCQSPSVVASTVIIITSALPLNALHASTRKKNRHLAFKTTQLYCLPNPTCVFAHVLFALDFKFVAEWTKSPFNLFAALNLNLQQAIRTLFVYPL